MCSMFLQILKHNIDLFLPTNDIRIHANDKPWINCEVKSLINKRQQAFKNKNENLWKHFRNKVKRAIISAKDKFYNKRIRKFKLNNPADWIAILKC